MPISKRVSAKYKDRLADIQKYIDNSDTSVTFTKNKPNWKGVRAAFYKLMQHLLYGDLSVEEVAEKIDTIGNREIENGIKSATLHE